MNRTLTSRIYVMIFLFMLYPAGPVSGQENIKDIKGIKRDPFIPLIDEKGNLRTSFQKPLNEPKAPEVKLMGISKINESFYAVIDGELVKETDTIKGLSVVKVEAEKVTLKFGEKIIELELNSEKR